MAHLDVQAIHKGLARALYRGVSIQKFPIDYFMYQMIIHEVRPDLIIEIGTMHGGSALYLADLLVLFGIEGAEVHTIDLIDPFQRREYHAEQGDKLNPAEATNYPEIVVSHPHVKTFSGGWEDYDLSNCAGFKRIMVIDDGSHVYSDVLAAAEKFKDLISSGSYLIIEDGNALEVCDDKERREWMDGGPLRAIFEFLSKNKDFHIDFRWCDMFGVNSTFNTYGYLRRV